MKELRGMPVVKAMTAKLSEEVKDLAGQGITPTLAIVRVGARPDDLSYERGATKRFTSVGAAVKVLELPETCTQEELEATVRGANEDAGVHGILIFRPLPKHLNQSVGGAGEDSPAHAVELAEQHQRQHTAQRDGAAEGQTY